LIPFREQERKRRARLAAAARRADLVAEGVRLLCDKLSDDDLRRLVSVLWEAAPYALRDALQAAVDVADEVAQDDEPPDDLDALRASLAARKPGPSVGGFQVLPADYKRKEP
jgi:hypothetical protein